MSLDLTAISDEFLNQCGSCDFGLPAACECPKRDHRSAMLDLVREVERLRRIESAALTWRTAFQAASGTRTASHDLIAALDEVAS